jgi:MoxR-like ATPase
MGDDSLKDLISNHGKGFVPALPGLLPFPWDMAKAVPAGAAPKPPNYLVSKELAAASWVALLLRQPLLLTGDPGVGKTRFAEKLASDLGLGAPSVIQVKSTTTGRELLYRFDDLARFRDASIVRKSNAPGGPAGPAEPAMKSMISYVQLQGLGRAIVRSAGAAAAVKLDPSLDRREIFGDLASQENLTLGQVFPREFDGTDGSPRFTLVLVDELDKAPRDTPNDLLAEIEQMAFRFDELGFEVRAQPAFKPIVIVTSNAERNLPDAFLRRCVFYRIETPTPEAMSLIAAARLGDIDANCKLMTSVIDFYKTVAARATEKKPGTAEFIALVAYLRAAGFTTDAEVPDEAFQAALHIVVKTEADTTAARAGLSARASAARTVAAGKT